jgi:ketosteroid isomerase-like protein
MKTNSVREVYTLWKDAVIKGDLLTLNEVYADNFLWTNNMGITDCKTKILSKASSQNIQYLSWDDENIDIQFQGENAILKSKQILRLRVFGHFINTEVNVIVQFINKDNTWLLETIDEFY